MNIYVGNLAYEMTEEDLKTTFETYGQVTSATIIKDKFTGKSKGFGFVEMPEKNEGTAAISGLDGKEIKGRTMRVNEAHPRTERGPGGGGGRGRDRDSRGGGGRF